MSALKEIIGRESNRKLASEATAELTRLREQSDNPNERIKNVSHCPIGVLIEFNNGKRARVQVNEIVQAFDQAAQLGPLVEALGKTTGWINNAQHSDDCTCALCEDMKAVKQILADARQSMGMEVEK